MPYRSLYPATFACCCMTVHRKQCCTASRYDTAFLHHADNTHQSLLWPHLQCFLPEHRSTDTTWFMTGVPGWIHQNVQHIKLQLESTEGTLCAHKTRSHSLIIIKQVSIQKVHLYIHAVHYMLQHFPISCRLSSIIICRLGIAVLPTWTGVTLNNGNQGCTL